MMEAVNRKEITEGREDRRIRSSPGGPDVEGVVGACPKVGTPASKLSKEL